MHRPHLGRGSERCVLHQDLGRPGDPPIDLSIVVPTIDGREHWLAKALKAFEKTTPVEYETIIIQNQRTCGAAWNIGIKQSFGDYILLAADDLQPLPGWYEAAVEVVERGFLPASRILNTDGTLQSCGDLVEELPDGTVVDLNRIPFCGYDLMQRIYPILPIHYATDHWFSHRAREEGWESVICRDFRFHHHFAPEGRLDDRLMKDMNVYWKRAGLHGVSMAAPDHLT